MSSKASKSSSKWLLGAAGAINKRDFGPIDWGDHKVAFAVRHCRGRRVLDVGCVEHNPENYKSRYWVHRALVEVAQELIGLDLYEEGIEYLADKGFKVVCGDAQNFSLQRQFDVVFAGDVIEHLDNPVQFLESVKRHLTREGILLISTPNPWYWRFVTKASMSANVGPNPEHTCWFCPKTLEQLCGRYGFALKELSYGSRYWRDRALPLPRGVKHTSFHAVFGISL